MLLLLNIASKFKTIFSWSSGNCYEEKSLTTKIACFQWRLQPPAGWRWAGGRRIWALPARSSHARWYPPVDRTSTPWTARTWSSACPGTAGATWRTTTPGTGLHPGGTHSGWVIVSNCLKNGNHHEKWSTMHVFCLLFVSTNRLSEVLWFFKI